MSTIGDEFVGMMFDFQDSSYSVGAYRSPVEFASEISFRHDVSSRQDQFDITLTPYLRDVLNACDYVGHGHREITIVAPEQTGKSLSWQISLLWAFLYAPGLSLVVYPSDDKADEVNRAKLLPLMRGVPELASELDMPKCRAKNRYNFGGFISYWQGSGERISAHAAQIRIADELDDWQEHEGHASKIVDLRKRGRSFRDSLFLKVSSPRGEKSAIWREFEKSSMGYWHLRCQGCGALTMPSWQIANMQFALDDSGGVVRGSERVICPTCHHEHEEPEKRQMNLDGKYLHEKDDEENIGFQWGALASQLESLNWTAIAKAQLLAGRSGLLEDQVAFDNSFRGRPLSHRPPPKDLNETLTAHCPQSLPDPEILEAVFLSVDTQDHGWKWEMRGLGTDSNRYLLGFGLAKYLELDDEKLDEIRAREEPESIASGQVWEPPTTLADIMAAGWRDVPVTMALIDEGGHRKREVSEFVAEHSRAFAYKGGAKTWERWHFSKNQPKLILCRRDEYQDSLLFYLYHQASQEAAGYWWLMPMDQMTDEYFAELSALRPQKSRREGHLRKNWDHEGRVHDFFDTGLIYLALEDVAISMLPATEWRHGKAEILKRAVEDVDTEDEVAALAVGRARNPWVKSWGMR